MFDKKYLMFNTVDEAQTFVDMIDDAMGYNGEGRTTTYSAVIPHPTIDKAAVLTCPKCHEYMTQDQIDSTITVVEFRALSWFPVYEEDV